MKHKEAGMQKLATRKQTIQTPFTAVLPPLKQSEQEALAADIKANGVLHPIVIDEYGNILDGHHRYAIDRNAPTRVVSGLSPDEKVAYTIRANLARRNLSSEQTREIAKQQKQIATNLRDADPKKRTQRAVGALLGVAQNTVSDWFTSIIGSDNTNKTPTPDARVKLNAAAKEAVAVRVKANENQAQIAADFGVSQATVSNIAKKADKAVGDTARPAKKEKPFDGAAAGCRLRDWLRAELDKWPEPKRNEAAHWIRQVLSKEYGL